MIRDLTLGMSGADVKAAQQALNKHLSANSGNTSGIVVEPNGDFGQSTKTAVSAFQTSKSLTSTGAINAATRHALFPIGVVTIHITGRRLRIPWLLRAQEPGLRPPHLLPHLQFSERRKEAQTMQTLGAGSFALRPNQLPWRAPPRLAPPLEMPHIDSTPHSAPLSPYTGTRGLAPQSRKFDIGQADPVLYGQRQAHSAIDCSNLDWSFGLPTHTRLNLNHAIQELNNDPLARLTRIQLKEFPDPLPAPIIPRFEGARDAQTAAAAAEWTFSRTELQGGLQRSWWKDDSNLTPDAMVLSIQFVYRLGPEEGTHEETGVGFSLGQPINTAMGEGDLWSFNPYYFYSYVDPFWYSNYHHLVQPLAQVGLQFSPNSIGKRWDPTLTANLCPVNMEVDPLDWLKISIQGCGVINLNMYKLADSHFGVSATGGITIAWEKFFTNWRNEIPTRFFEWP
jgi:hypothetical protein